MIPDQIKELEEQIEEAEGEQKVKLLNDLAFEYFAYDSNKMQSYSEQALKLAEELNFKSGMGLSLRTIGISYYARENYDKALEYSYKALRIFEGIDDKNGMIKSYVGIGNILFAQSNYKQALECHLKVLNLSKSIDDLFFMAASYNNLGMVYQSQDFYSKALECYHDALKIFKEIGDKHRISLAYNNIGIIHDIKKEHQQALEFHLKSLQIKEELGDSRAIAYSNGNIGMVYYYMEDYEQALKYYLKALEMFEEVGIGEGIVKCYSNIGGAYLFLKNYHLASIYLHKGLLLAQKFGAKSIELEYYINITKLSEEQSDFKQTLFYQRKVMELDQELFNAEKSKIIIEMQTKYEIEKKELDNLRLQQELKLLTKHISRKNKPIGDLKSKIQTMEIPPSCQTKADEIIQYLDYNKPAHEEWADFQIQFDRAYPDFLLRLSDTYPRLTRQELKGCALIRTGLSTRELSQTLHIAYRSADSLRYRIRKKLTPPAKQSLAKFLSNF